MRTAEPVRGDLSVYIHRGFLSAFLLPAIGQADPLVLEACVLTRMRGASFIVVGREVEHNRGEEHRCEQAWWCRLPAGLLKAEAVMDLNVIPTREERRAQSGQDGAIVQALPLDPLGRLPARA